MPARRIELSSIGLLSFFVLFDVDVGRRFLAVAALVCLFVHDRRSLFLFLLLRVDEVLCVFGIVRPPFFTGVVRRFSFTSPSFF